MLLSEKPRLNIYAFEILIHESLKCPKLSEVLKKFQPKDNEMKIFVEFVRVLVDYYLEKPLVTDPQMSDETKTFIWKLMVAKPNN